MMAGHEVIFIDNDYFHYDHALHLEAVKRYRPKYATVRDLMTSSQCQQAGIPYYSFEQVMDWAAELAEYAHNVIVIPKYDCLERIPAQYVLGYSIPTSHGGTPMPFAMFQGRPIHLLGGSPSKQIAYWQADPADVVSIDNNYILKAARYGQAWCADGQDRSITELGFGAVTTPLYLALVISLTNFAAFFQRSGVRTMSEAEIGSMRPELPDA